ncbi:MAG: hypothetical protein AB7J28_02195 [Hyphomonadaceae bacterium]
MNGLVLLLGQVAIFLLALGGIFLFSVLTLRFAAPALSKARAPLSRAAHGFAALASLAGIVACAAGGFLGIAYLLYIAQQ